MNTTNPPTYEIKSVHDFARVPQDRRDVCLREFAVWLALVDATLEMMSDIPVEPPEAFVWIDDDKHRAEVSISSGDERVLVAAGVMTGFSDGPDG